MAKEWAWSYSKFKNFVVCPKRHYEVDLAKHFVEDSEQLTWGNTVHDALRDATTGKVPLPDTMKDYQRWITEITGGPGKIFVEQKYAITKDFQPTSYFANNVWYRGIADVVRMDGPVALARDYKTGQLKHDSRQLMLMAQCLFSHYPMLRRIKTEFVWLKDDCVTPEIFNRDTIAREWPPILPTVAEMEAANRTMTYPPKPGKLCARYCPVTSCPFHGKRH